MANKAVLVKEAADRFEFLRDSAPVLRHIDDFPDRHMAYDLLTKYFRGVYEDHESGRPLAWINYAVPSEVFRAMGVTPVVIDNVIGLKAQSPEGVIKYIDEGEIHFPDYLCATNKAFLGAAMVGDIPIPNIIVHPSHPCDSNIATYPVIAEFYKIPYFCIDTPYFRNEAGLRHVVDEWRSLINFIQENTGQRLVYERLREVMEYSNRAHLALLKLNELGTSVPSPFSSMDMLIDYPVVLCLAGTPELAEYAELKYEAAKRRIQTQRGKTANERVRLCWIYGAPAFDFSLYTWLEREHGAMSVGNMSNNFIMKPVEDLSSIDSILMGIALKTMQLPMGRECGGPWENYISAMMDLCRRVKADAAVFAGHVACKANWAIMKLVKDRLEDELGIPTLIFTVDLFDPRVVSTEDIKGIFENFLAVHFPE